MTTCIILAAGKSERFGTPKMRHTLANGQPMLVSTISLYNQIFDEVNVVVEPSDKDITQLALAAGATIITSPNAAQGMSQSLVASIQAYPKSRRWLLGLGDMPYILPATLRSMLADNHDIVAPRFAGRMGNPVIFGSVFKSQLLSLRGDRGARSIIGDNIRNLSLIDVEDPGVLHDIDRPSDVRPS